MPGPRKEGLLGQGMATGDGKHLYHAEKPPVIAHTAEHEAKFRAEGYGDDYIFQEYPKQVNGKTVKNADEEKAALEVAE